MADFDVSGMLGLDASEFVGGADEAAGAMEGVSGEAENTADSLYEIDAAGVAAGGAMAGIGTAAQGALDDTQSMRETLGRTAVSTEMTRDETSKLAQEIQNATFPMEDATATMDSLAQQGVTTEDELRETANAADMVADATGTSAESIADNAVPAIKAMGGEAGDLNEHMDTFTFIARNTAMDVEDFSRVVTKMGPELQEMGLSVDETAQYIAALEEKGLDSRTAMREFRQAARGAEGDQAAMKKELGLTNAELGAQEEALKAAEGSTKEHSEAANESLTTMDKLRAGFEESKLAAAEAIGPIDAIAPAMQTAGMMAMTMSTINFSAVIPSLVGVASAAAPVVIPLLAIAAAVGALYYAWENNIFGIRDIAHDAFGQILNIADTVKTMLPSSVDEGVSAASRVFRNWHPAGIMWDKRNAIMDALPSYSDLNTRGKNLITGMINGIRSKAGSLRDTASGIADSVRSYLPGSDAEEGPLSDLTDAGAALPETMASGMQDAGGAVAEAGREMAAGAKPGVGGGAAGGAAGGAGGGLSVELSVDGDSAVQALFAAIEDDIEATIRQREQSQTRRSDRLGVRR